MRTILLLLAVTLSSLSVQAQITSLSFSAKTGDAQLDASLTSINSQGSADFSLFKKDMAVSFGVTETKINYLSVTVKMAPGDIYMTLELARITGKTIDQIVVVYNAKKGQGWGVIAKELGIKPGSKEFHALKDSAKGKDAKMKAKKTPPGKTKVTPAKKETVPVNKGKK
jgi:hypothetical protein